MTDRKEPSMHAASELQLRMVNEQIARDRRQAAHARLADQARRRHRPSLRLRAGHALIAFGRRLAAEPSLRTERA
jgi:hypothetical protein